MKTENQTKELLTPMSKRNEIKKEAHHLLSWQLTERQICDLELLLNGGFAPLKGFMDNNDYNSVLKDMRLEDGNLWPMPITLDVNEQFTESVIRLLSNNKKNLVFLLWGSYAHKKEEFIDKTNNLILKAPHPSPLSAYTGFFGCKHFSKTNNYLKKCNIKEIEW